MSTVSAQIRGSKLETNLPRELLAPWPAHHRRRPQPGGAQGDGRPVGTDYVQWALTRREASSSEKHVLFVLAHYTDCFKVCRPSMDRIIDESGLSKSTVYRALNGLEEKNLICRTNGAGRATTIYNLQKPKGFEVVLEEW